MPSERFPTQWLALREPFDVRARSPRIQSAVDALFAALNRPPQIVDLGGGTGSNFRAMAAGLPDGTRWTAIDHDTDARSAGYQAIGNWAVQSGGRAVARDGGMTLELPDKQITVTFRQHDLSRNLDLEALQAADLVTTSAFLDLVSESWLERLIEALAGRPFHAVLTVDGRLWWDPAAETDDRVRAAFARDQNRDKGFGPALGPSATRRAATLFKDAGYNVHTADSDWLIGPADTQMLTAMIEGIARAAQSWDQSPVISRWREYRLAEINAKALTMTVGHQDMICLTER